MRLAIPCIALVALGLAAPGEGLAQQSASFKLTESSVNAGGHPGASANPASGSFRISLGSLGELGGEGALASASFRVAGGFGSLFPPPGEVPGLRFVDRTTLAWGAEKSAGSYNLYRDALAALSGGGFGACFRQQLAATTTSDSDPLAAGAGFFYLVTVENRLSEEGTKGWQSGGAERRGTFCP